MKKLRFSEGFQAPIVTSWFLSLLLVLTQVSCNDAALRGGGFGKDKKKPDPGVDTQDPNSIPPGSDVTGDPGDTPGEFTDLLLSGLRMEGPIETPSHVESIMRIRHKGGQWQEIQWPEKGGSATLPGVCLKGGPAILEIEIRTPDGQMYTLNQGGCSANNGSFCVIGHEQGNSSQLGYEINGGKTWHEIDGALVNLSCPESNSLKIDQLCSDQRLMDPEIRRRWIECDLECGIETDETPITCQ